MTNLSQKKVNHETVAMIEDLLAKAKAGELQSLMYVDGYFDGKAGHGWDGVPTMKMIGHLRALEFTYFAQRILREPEE